MRSFQRLIILFATFFVAPIPVHAGPVFEIISNGSSAPFALSGFWGFSATGGGGMTGKITLRDDFVLPTGGTTTFGLGDVTSLEYAHIQTPFSNGTVTPQFSFFAGQSDLTAVFGQVADLGGGNYTISAFNLAIDTSIPAALFSLPGGVYEGVWELRGIAAQINDTTNTPSSPIVGVRALIPLSTAPGNWILTGTTTSVSSPGAALILGVAAAALFVRRRAGI